MNQHPECSFCHHAATKFKFAVGLCDHCSAVYNTLYRRQRHYKGGNVCMGCEI